MVLIGKSLNKDPLFCSLEKIAKGLMSGIVWLSKNIWRFYQRKNVTTGFLAYILGINIFLELDNLACLIWILEYLNDFAQLFWVSA